MQLHRNTRSSYYLLPLNLIIISQFTLILQIKMDYSDHKIYYVVHLDDGKNTRRYNVCSLI